MTTSRTCANLLVATAVVGSALAATVAAPIAHADPLGNIIAAVNKDRAASGCPQLIYNPVLQDAAEAYANSENIADSRPGNYNGQVIPYLGSGDPQAAAINSAYRQGAGGTLGVCSYTEFGVGFVRHEDRSVDVVTIVFGTPGPPPDKGSVNIGSPVLAPDEPSPSPRPKPPNPTRTATVTSDVDLYDKPNVPDGAGKIIGMLRAGTVVKVSAPCPSDDWCLLTDPAGAAYGSFFRND